MNIVTCDFYICIKKFLFSVSKLPMNQEAVIFGPKLAFLPIVVKLFNAILLIGPSWLPTVGLMLVQSSRPTCICWCKLQSSHNGLSVYRYYATVHWPFDMFWLISRQNVLLSKVQRKQDLFAISVFMFFYNSCKNAIFTQIYEGFTLLNVLNTVCRIRYFIDFYVLRLRFFGCTM